MVSLTIISPDSEYASVLTQLTTGQGQVLGQFYNSQGIWAQGGLHKTENWFKLAFQDYSGISYCVDASIRDCTNGMMTLAISDLYQ
jgi:hypothetical protein